MALELIVAGAVAAAGVIGSGVAGWLQWRWLVESRDQALASTSLVRVEPTRWVGEARGNPVVVHGSGRRLQLEVACARTEFGFRRPAGLGRLVPRKTLGDPGFDTGVRLEGDLHAALAVLEPDLRSKVLRAARRGVSLHRGTLRARAAPAEVARTLAQLTELSVALGQPVDIDQRLAAVMAEPQRKLQLRAARFLATRKTPAGLATLRQRARDHVDWEVRYIAARAVGDPTLMAELASEAGIPWQLARKAHRWLRARSRQPAVHHLLQSCPIDGTAEEQETHLQALRAVLQPGDPAAVLLQWASQLTATTTLLREMVLTLGALASADAARAAVELVARHAHADPTTTTGPLARLVGKAGRPELLAPIHDLIASNPAYRDALLPAIDALRLRRLATTLQHRLDGGLEVHSDQWKSKKLRIELVGTHHGRPVQIAMGSHWARVEVRGLPRAARIHRLEVLTPPRPHLDWLHHSVRDAVSDLAPQTRAGGLRRGVLAANHAEPSTPDRPDPRATSSTRAASLGALVEAVVRVADAVHALDADATQRLIRNLRDEPDEAWRWEFAATLMSTVPEESLRPVRAELLADRDLSIRLAAAQHFDDRGVMVAVAGDPTATRATIVAVLEALRGRPELGAAALVAAQQQVDLTTPSLVWVLEQLVQHPEARLEPLLIRALDVTDAELRLDAVAGLAQVGSTRAVAPLREAAGRRLLGPLRREAEAAIEAIRARTGVAAGALSLMDPSSQEGGLSVARTDAGGGLTLEEPGDG